MRETDEEGVTAGPADHTDPRRSVVTVEEVTAEEAEPAAAPSPIDPFSLLTPTDAPEPIEVQLISRDGSIESLRLDSPVVLIGRGSGCDLRLPDPDVSERHAVLIAAGNHYFAIDLGARKPLQVNWAPVPCGWFGPGDEIAIGPFILRRPASEDRGTPVPAATILLTRQENPPTKLTLRLARSGRPPRDAVLERPVTLVGRAPICKVRLVDPNVSKVHAGLFLLPSGLLALDLLSRQGIILNGTPVKAAYLQADDQVRIGSQWFEVVKSGKTAALPISRKRSTSAPENAKPAPPAAGVPKAESANPTPVKVKPRHPEVAIGESQATASGRLPDVDRLTSLLSDDSRWCAELLRESFHLLLPFPDPIIAAELDRLHELAAQRAELCLSEIKTAPDARPKALPSTEVLDAEREHCRRTILNLLSEFSGHHAMR